jgi:hypothetical protein
MPYILVIDKMGAIKEINIKEYKEEDLHKKANFKSAEGFALQTTWTGLSVKEPSVKPDISVSVYGKKAGKAGQENKYEFPPPIDSVLFFGGCVLVAKTESDESVRDLRVSTWNKIYDTLMGGFEDILSSPLGDHEVQEEEDEEEEEDIDPNLIGKNGYVRDGFVVEDDEDDAEYELPEDEELDIVDTESEEEVKPKKKSSRKPAAVTKAEKKPEKKKTDKKKKSSNSGVIECLPDISIADVTENYLDCSSELVEEEYV